MARALQHARFFVVRDVEITARGVQGLVPAGVPAPVQVIVRVVALERVRRGAAAVAVWSALAVLTARGLLPADDHAKTNNQNMAAHLQFNVG